MTKVLGLLFSARTGGNLHGIATNLFAAITAVNREIGTELIEAAQYQVNPCNGCDYECMLGAEKGFRCPIEDDVPELWRRAWSSDLVVYFLPTYSGMPPASWVAFQQRYHGVYRSLGNTAPAPNGKMALVTIHNPTGSGLGDASQSLIIRHLAGHARELVHYEPIIPGNYDLSGMKDRLIAHPEIQASMARMGARLAKALAAPGAGA